MRNFTRHDSRPHTTKSARMTLTRAAHPVIGTFFRCAVMLTFISDVPATACATASEQLADTEPLTWDGDLAARMVDGIDRFLLREISAARGKRARHWHRDTSSQTAYDSSVAANRARLARIIGAEEVRASGFEILDDGRRDTRLAATDAFDVFAIRWKVLPGVDGDGLALVPRKPHQQCALIAIGDADQSPEMLTGLAPGIAPESQFARRLAESGYFVIVPRLVNRDIAHSIVDGAGATNQPHREFVYRAAYEMGHHVIGYEVQKVRALLDLAPEPWNLMTGKIGVFGYGEGGLVALHVAAMDTRIDAVCVSGYFDDRRDVWQEPIYRNVWSLLEEFGDAELASLVAPRGLIIEACRFPAVSGPPEPKNVRIVAAPGRLRTPSLERVRAEVDRARSLVRGFDPPAKVKLVTSEDGNGPPASDAALRELVRSLSPELDIRPATLQPESRIWGIVDAAAHQAAAVGQLVVHTQQLMRQSAQTRDAFWSDADETSLSAWEQTTSKYRAYFRDGGDRAL